MSSELSATVTLSSYSWGTRIDMNCTYGVDNSDHESDSQGRRQAGDGGGGSRRQPQSGGDLGGASRRDRLTRRQHLHPGRSDRRHQVVSTATTTYSCNGICELASQRVRSDRLLLARTCWDDADWSNEPLYGRTDNKSPTEYSSTVHVAVGEEGRSTRTGCCRSAR